MSKDPHGSSVHYDQFLYALAELERALERGPILWPPGGTKMAQRRIAELFVKVEAASKRPPAK
jgi:hypothetical protein